jgi:DNA polymerase III delta prime subunit
MKHSIWVEKWRPRSLKDVIFQDERQQRQFLNFAESRDLPNMLLSGVQGTGKTSISKALINDLGVDKSDVLRINCSDKKIDALRHEVTSFAMTLPLGSFKVVQLEELDYIGMEGMALLRGLIEDTSLSTRYIATCNYENKIIPALKSRFQQFSFKAPDKDKIALRMADILEKEKIEFDPEVLLTYVDVAYPDVRKTIQLLQSNCQGGQLLSPQSATTDTDWRFGLLDAISAGNFKAARQLVCGSTTKEEHADVYTFLYQNIAKLRVKDHDAAIVVLAEYMRNHALASDTELNLAACFIALASV